MAAVRDEKGTLILSEDELFAALASSAFEFLAKAIEEFSASAKFSTVHFAIAIELFLKARLMREHWALLLDKPDQADKAAFFRGEAKTVSPEQALDRLRKIAGVQIPPVSREIFLKIAKHRNKMVHFVHAGEMDVDGKEGLALIVAEQCAGWLALRLLLEEWREFEVYEEDIQRIGFQMERHRAYLEESFKAKQDVLEAHRKGGGRVTACPSCKFDSVRVFEATGAISPASCVVCRYNGSEIEITCINEDCQSVIQFNAYEMAPGQCPGCGMVIDEDFLREALDTGEAVTPDNYFDHVDMSCPFCSGYHTVVEHHGGYVCVQCFETSDEMGICGHCGECQLGGAPEHSSLVGCEFCEGSAGRYADD